MARHLTLPPGLCADSFPPLTETYHTAGNERGPFLRATVLLRAL